VLKNETVPTEMQLHVSLHDVSPFHLDRLEHAEGLFAEWGLSKVSYLLIPDFHHQCRADQSPAFVSFCRKSRPFEVEWLLHGLFHLEQIPPGARSLRERLLRRLMTAGEGEFLALSAEEIGARVRSGLKTFRQVLGTDPAGFVPPAWLHNKYLNDILSELGIPLWESHHGLYRSYDRKALRAPVITWATRSLMRRKSSLLACPFLSRHWRREPLLRVAVHPYDFDWPEIRRSIARVLLPLLSRRVLVHCRDLKF
jgi:predicted deacetylase